MKVEAKEIENKFKPIVLEIVIESEQELCDLWLRHNASDKLIDKAQNSITHFNHKANNDLTTDLFELLGKLCKQRELFLNKKE